MTHPILNIDDVEVRPADPDRMPAGESAGRYDLRYGEIASRIGARKLGYNVTVVAPGKRSCPFHSHRAEEEMFFILEGNGEVRIGAARYPVRSGDLIACPTGGPETAHQIINTGRVEMRYLAVSTLASLEICDYPDSGKFGVYAELGTNADGTAQRLRYLGRQQDTRDYWEGE
ncbi:MAG: cupin domain-containing protein [Rhodanobacteraceae bacterium]